MSAYGFVFAHVLFPAWELYVRGRRTTQHLAGLTRTQWSNRKELDEIQSSALRALIRHAYDNVPFYRLRMVSAGVMPEDIRSPADLTLLPPLTRQEAQQSIQSRQAVSGLRPTLWKSTGGTTGQPLRFGYDVDSEAWREAVRQRGYAWAGYFLGRRALHFWGAPSREATGVRAVKVALDHVAKRNRYIDCAVRSEQVLAGVVRAIRSYRPTVLVCYAGAAADLARYVLETGSRTWPDIPVLCGAEALVAEDRERMVRAFGPGVFETYGCREIMLIAAECQAHDGMHVSVEHLVVEVAVEQEGRWRAAKPGERGEILVTDLHNFGMPFIRYQLGDLAVRERDEPCACGRELPRLREIVGRKVDTLRDAEGAPVDGISFNRVFTTLAEQVQQFQVVQHVDGTVTLRVVPQGEIDAAASAHLGEYCSRVLKGVTVRTELVQEIPLGPNGKRRFVIVE
jgi:phenylacetate-CoA ligase